VTVRGKALSLFVLGLLVAVPLLFSVATPGPTEAPLAAAMKRVPQHLMSREPGTAGGVQGVEGTPALPGRPTGTRSTGTDPVIVIPIEFQDVSHTSPAHDTAYFNSMMNSASGQSVNAFYRENSYGTFGFQATIANWVRSARMMSDYGRDGSGVDDGNGPIYRLVSEAVRAADASVNFANFDRNNDGVVDHVVIVHAGAAQESSPNTNLIWSHRWAVIDGDTTVPGDQRLVADGVQIYGYVMISEDSPFGVLAHEFGHDLGLPDLYDTDGSSAGVGIWDVMGGGSWNGNPRGTSPSHFSAWSKIQLGWATPIEVTSGLLAQPIRAVENNSVVYRLTVKSAAGGDEYFLVENREDIGYDAAQPGPGGLLIWHVDDSVQNNDNEAHRLLDVEEADEGGPDGDHPSDATDRWASDLTGWGPDSNPNSNGYGNVRTGWKVRHISAPGIVMTADLSREVDDDLSVVKITHPFAVPVAGPIDVEVTLRNVGARAQTNVQTNLAVYLNSFDPSSQVGIPNGGQVVPTFASGAFVNLSWQFTAASEGSYILDARVTLAGDEIPENNERLGHVSSRTLYLQQDVESGTATWTMPNQTWNDAYRWQVVNDTDVPGYGKAHSSIRDWRFGYYPTLIPSLTPPVYHYLQSPSVVVPPGPLYLLYYQRYDLSRTETANATETDHAYVEVMVDSGPWVKVAHFTAKDIGWKAVSLNLTSLLSGGPASVTLRFNVTSNIMPNTGGWWIDDIMLTSTNLSRAVAVLPIVPDRTMEPGAEAVFTFKLANVGDYDDEFRFTAVIPSGWTAVIVSNSTTVAPVNQARVTLASDSESNLQFRVQSPEGVLRGTVEQITLTAFSTNDASERGDFIVTARIADPLGLGGVQKYIVWIIVLGIALVVVVILVDHAKSRRFRGHIR